ncbi:MAG: HIT family protein [Bacteroidota bacterium]|nr:HIT family protein [Bacteroidota bacterium]MEC8361556.1 HIT family protein [Bacteroidota bacterium]MEC8399841.1 HIT family protein [Bacteroidota bacterium]
MASIFSKIVAGDIPCHRVAESASFLAFLDIMPLAPGHTLVIPKVEVDRIWDLEPALLGDLHVFSQKVALAMEDVMPCQRVGQAVIGLEVPHAHVHLIPLNAVADINFERPKLQVTQEELAEVAARIRDAFEVRYPA